ncbi:MAG: CinA family protein [Actinomycetota bacterium]|nr:CinA family protein [Actinomycetota bacterium]
MNEQMSTPNFDDLVAAAHEVAAALRSAGQRVAVSESAAGGLINAALVAVPGASDFYIGGMIVYTGAGRHVLAGDEPPPADLRGATEEFAVYQASAAAQRYRAEWGIGETGATGPSGNPYGDPAGHGWVGCTGPGPSESTRQLSTRSDDRSDNMHRFALAALELAAECIVAGNGGATG